MRHQLSIGLKLRIELNKSWEAVGCMIRIALKLRIR